MSMFKMSISRANQSPESSVSRGSVGPEISLTQLYATRLNNEQIFNTPNNRNPMLQRESGKAEKAVVERVYSDPTRIEIEDEVMEVIFSGRHLHATNRQQQNKWDLYAGKINAPEVFKEIFAFSNTKDEKTAKHVFENMKAKIEAADIGDKKFWNVGTPEVAGKLIFELTTCLIESCNELFFKVIIANADLNSWVEGVEKILRNRKDELTHLRKSMTEEAEIKVPKAKTSLAAEFEK